MTEIVAGGCLCGAVAFRISGEFESFFLCHCIRCRKDTGTAFAANLFSSTAVIHWLKGEEKIRSFRLPGTLHEKSFCSECGSALPTVQMNGDMLVVPAGCLDGPAGIRPTAHIFHSRRAEWDVDLDRVQKLDGLPG